MSNPIWTPKNIRTGLTAIAGAAPVTTILYTVPLGCYAILEDVFGFITNHGNAVNTTTLVINTTTAAVIHDIVRMGYTAAPASPLIVNKACSIYLNEGDTISMVTAVTAGANVAMTVSIHLKVRQ